MKPCIRCGKLFEPEHDAHTVCGPDCPVDPPPTRWTEEQLKTPYPWCIGAPTKEDCIKAGYCRRNPNCGD